MGAPHLLDCCVLPFLFCSRVLNSNVHTGAALRAQRGDSAEVADGAEQVAAEDHSAHDAMEEE
jgi:hypothetical protein